MPQKIIWRPLRAGELIEEGDFWFLNINSNNNEGLFTIPTHIILPRSYRCKTPVEQGEICYWRPIRLIETNTEQFIHSTINTK